MSERFFTSTPITGMLATLEGPEAHHLVRVMRAKVGETVTLFDGSGCEFNTRIETIGKKRVELSVQERRELNRESPIALTLAVALPKGERQRWLLEKIVELGVARLIPLETQRGVAQPLESALERLRRNVIEASKQCGRNRLLEIAEPRSWRQYAAGLQPNVLRLMAHPGGASIESVLQHGAPLGVQNLVAAIGPEGGFAEEEVATALAAGWTAVDLGLRILRVETAAVAIAAWAAFKGNVLAK